MKKFLCILVAILTVSCSKSEEKRVDFLLDWLPNTNHTGLFVALEKGYFKELGIDFRILNSTEESTSDLVINGKAPFGIYFQDYLSHKLARGAKVTAVAAIIEHNTAGILANTKNINDIKSYGTYNYPIELAIIKQMLNGVKIVPNNDFNLVASIENKMFDSGFAYYGWDGVLAGDEFGFFYFADFNKKLDFYSPIIIVNDEFLANNKDLVKKVLKAIKKGYIYAINEPVESAKILIKHAPELASKKDLIISSQKYLSSVYASDPNKWGEIDANRWNGFYEWINEQGIVKNPVPLNVGFSNEYLRD